MKGIIREFRKDKSGESTSNYIFVLDNASIHRSPEVKRYLLDNKIRTLYNISCNPEGNLIEWFFALLKGNLKTQVDWTEEGILEQIEHKLKLLSSFKILALNRYYLKECIGFSEKI